MKLKPLYCDSCQNECRGFSRPVSSYILCNDCNYNKLHKYGYIVLINGIKLLIENNT